MAEPDTKGLYPHATPLGQPIPFEIVRPLGLIIQPFSGVATNNVAIPEAAGFLILRADADCLVELATTTAVPADGVHTPGLIFVGEGEVVVIDHNAAAQFSVIAAGAEDGTLIVQTVTKYSDIRKTVQTQAM